MGKTKRKSSRSVPEPLIPFLAPIQAVQDLLTHFGEQGVIIGGVAASLLGTPRFTADVDVVLMLDMEDLPRLLEVVTRLGFELRIPDAADFARKNRMLLLRHTDSAVDVDLSLGVLPFEMEMVERSQVVAIGPTRLRLPTAEDLIIMKAVAHRPKDLEDIRAVAASHAALDKERIQFWVEQFGAALEMPDLCNEILKLL
jgi:predicted nucleotidyltransferase